MKRTLLSALFLVCFSTTAYEERLTDSQVKQQILRESVYDYPGNCPCPYNRASNGSRCGKRSAWNRAGGYEPICYEEEVDDSMVTSWRRANNQE